MSSRRLIGPRSLALWLLASTALTYPAIAAQLSGKTVRVSTTATASGEEGARTLDAPGDIFQGDVITTDGSGEAQIVFLDNTRFAIGPGSRVTIDEFVFNPNGTAASVTLAAVKGTFRFVGGRSNDEAYSIRTPTATIGIRGTVIDFGVDEFGRTTILWQGGFGRICVIPVGSLLRRPTDCTDVAIGDMYVAPPGGGLFPVAPGERIDAIKQSLYYATSQATLEDEFQTTETGRPPPAPAPRIEPQERGGGPYR